MGQHQRLFLIGVVGCCFPGLPPVMLKSPTRIEYCYIDIDTQIDYFGKLRLDVGIGSSNKFR